MKIKESSNSTLYGLTILSVVILFLGLQAIQRFAPPSPRDYSVTVKFDSRDYPGGLVSIKTYEDLLHRYEKTETKLSEKDRDSGLVVLSSNKWRLIKGPKCPPM